MSISLLKTLIAISEQGSFLKAADRVCVSQAAIGQQMKRLESLLRVELFDRVGKKPVLNPLGHALVGKARDVVNGYDTLLDGLIGDAQLFGNLDVGAVPSMIRALVPISIRRLIKDYPALHIRVVPGLSDDLYEQVERGAIDAAIMSEPAQVPAGMIWQPFAREDFVLITSPEITETDPYKILHELPYIRHQRRTAAGKLTEKWLNNRNISVRATMEMESLETLSSMVAYNLGVSVVPNVCVPDEVFSRLRKIPLGPDPAFRIVGVLNRAENPKIRLLDALMTELKATVAFHN